MQALIILVVVGFALYLFGQVFLVAIEIINALMKGANQAAISVPRYGLKILGRRDVGAKVDIDPILNDDQDRSLRAYEIKELISYEPNIGNIYAVRDVKYEGDKIFDQLGKRNFVPNNNICVDDLEKILKPNSVSVYKKIEELTNHQENFPIDEPKKVTLINPPPSIKPYQKLQIRDPAISLPLREGFLARLNGYVYKEFEHELNLVDKAKIRKKELLDLEAEQEEAIQIAFNKANAKYEEAKKHQDISYRQALDKWKNLLDDWNKAKQDKEKQLEKILNISRGDEGVSQQVGLILDNLELPSWIPCDFEVKYDSESKILIVEHQFIDVGAVDWFKNVKLKTGWSKKPLNQKELKSASERLYPSLTLRIAYELAQQLKGEVEAIAVNGWSYFTVKATGAIKRAYCSSLLGTIDDLRNLNLTLLDPLASFESFKGTSARTLELTPIAPKIRIDTNDPRFVDEKDVLGVMSSEQNLASMDWQDFEHLCRQLFEKVFASSGAIVKVTQASRDLGVDAIIFDPDTIRGGKIVIQAKRYVNTVDVSAVRDLWGTVNHEGAMKGILVTTSQYGPESYSFIQDKPLTLIDGRMLLGLLEEHGYKFRINLEEARKILKDSQG